jgi:hypothetical protein
VKEVHADTNPSRPFAEAIFSPGLHEMTGTQHPHDPARGTAFGAPEES